MTIRDATLGDYALYLRLLPELGVEDPAPDEKRFAEELVPRGLVLEEGGEEIGWSHAEVIGEVGYVRNVIVDPARRRRGAGRGMMEALRERLRAKGCTSWRLNVKADNAAAIALYEKFGMATAYRTAVVRIAWSAVERLPEARRSVEGRIVEAAEDGAIEAAFAIPAGQLAGFRAMEGQILIRLVDRDRPAEPRVGVVRFNAGYPGAFPFKVAEPDLARALLEAMRPYARPEHAEVQLVIEDDDATVALVRAAGATLKLELLHMRGAL